MGAREHGPHERVQAAGRVDPGGASDGPTDDRALCGRGDSVDRHGRACVLRDEHLLARGGPGMEEHRRPDHPTRLGRARGGDTRVPARRSVPCRRGCHGIRVAGPAGAAVSDHRADESAAMTIYINMSRKINLRIEEG